MLSLRSIQRGADIQKASDCEAALNGDVRRAADDTHAALVIPKPVLPARNLLPAAKQQIPRAANRASE